MPPPVATSELVLLEEIVTKVSMAAGCDRPTVSALGVVGQAPVRDDHIPSWYGGVGVNVNIPVFNGFANNARAKAAERFGTS